jgi:hypothetical protein
MENRHFEVQSHDAWPVLGTVWQAGTEDPVTRCGQPVEELAFPRASGKSKHGAGSFAGTGQIIGGIVSLASGESDGEGLRMRLLLDTHLGVERT